MSLDQVISIFSESLHSSLFPGVLGILIMLSPIALAVTLFIIGWGLWVDYVRSYNFLKMKYTVLELRLPKETYKSPLAMESVLHALHNTSDGSKFAQYWKGETRPWFSLEIASVEGQVRFFIWTEDRRKQSVMAPLYSQFPGIEIYEVEDYAKNVQFDPKTMRIWAAEFVLAKEDSYPIKTYVDYNLDKDPKEEYKVDPLAPFIEFMGGLKPNQQNWLQIMIRSHNKEQRKPGKLFEKTDKFKDDANKTINKLLVRDSDTKVAGEPNDKGFPMVPTLSKVEQDTVTAIERKMSKLLFDVGVRVLYISPKDTFDTPYGIGGNIASMKQFSVESWNGFKPNGDKWHAQFKGLPWEDYKNMRRDREAKLALAAYKRRSFFYTPFAGKPNVLNTEELATMYHFPGSTVATPGLSRIPSKKSTAPTNLPV